MWIQDDENRFLIQQRSAQVDDPHTWAPTCGCVIQGEESQEAAIREVREELGIHISPDEMKKVVRLVGPDILVGSHIILDIWLIHKCVPIEEISFSDGEVSQVKWASRSEIKELMAGGRFPSYGPNYLKRVLG